jgi:hypothetical protein
MARNPEYQTFLDIHYGRKKDPDPKGVELPATEQEIGWWKQQQFRKAMRHAREGHATDIELIYLAKRGHYYKGTPKEYIKKPPTLWERRNKAQAGEATRDELIMLAGEGYYYPTTPPEYRRKPLPKDSD